MPFISRREAKERALRILREAEASRLQAAQREASQLGELPHDLDTARSLVCQAAREYVKKLRPKHAP